MNSTFWRIERELTPQIPGGHLLLRKGVGETNFGFPDGAWGRALQKEGNTSCLVSTKGSDSPGSKGISRRAAPIKNGANALARNDR